jgi:hypothetical protein
MATKKRWCMMQECITLECRKRGHYLKTIIMMSLMFIQPIGIVIFSFLCYLKWKREREYLKKRALKRFLKKYIIPLQHKKEQ